MADNSKVISYCYIFKLGDDIKKEFEVRLDAETLNCIPARREMNPEWTRLGYCKCENCPVEENQYEFCPIALNIVDLVNSFKDSVSYEKAEVLVKTPERDISKSTTIQKGLSSLMGIYMVTSSCPIMERLKPMVCYHLPFASIKETTYRAVSMYLLGQYFLNKKGKEPDWELKGLIKIYQNIRLVNKGICQRISNASDRDANINAVVILDAFANMIPYSIEDTLGEFEYLFASYL